MNQCPGLVVRAICRWWFEYRSRQSIVFKIDPLCGGLSGIWREGFYNDCLIRCQSNVASIVRELWYGILRWQHLIEHCHKQINTIVLCKLLKSTTMLTLHPSTHSTISWINSVNSYILDVYGRLLYCACVFSCYNENFWNL